MPGETAPGADLGGSSKYSSEILEDRSGEGFRANSTWARVSRTLGLGETRTIRDICLALRGGRTVISLPERETG